MYCVHNSMWDVGNHCAFSVMQTSLLRGRFGNTLVTDLSLSAEVCSPAVPAFCLLPREIHEKGDGLCPEDLKSINEHAL